MTFLSDDHRWKNAVLSEYFAPNEDCGAYGLLWLVRAPTPRAGGGRYCCFRWQNDVHAYKIIGLIAQIFNPNSLEKLQGSYAIGHTRYSTTGSSSIRNCPAIHDRDNTRPSGSRTQWQLGKFIRNCRQRLLEAG